MPTGICDEHDRWRELVKLCRRYPGRIALVRRTRPETADVKEVVFTKRRATQRGEGYLPFRLRLTIYLHDGRSLNVEALASSLVGRDPISCVLTLNGSAPQRRSHDEH